MSDAQKLNAGFSLNKAARAKALDHIHLTGKNLPASIVSKKGSIVTVKFETGGVYTLPNVTIPMHMPEWTRLPMQKGDKGVVWAGDVNISAMTGLGPNNPPSFTRPGNLAPLTFIPVGNTSFFSVDDNKHVNYGKNGAQIADQTFKSFVGTDSSGSGSTLKGSVPTGTPDPTNITASTYKHTVTTDDTNGVVNASTKKVDHNAPNVNVNASDTHTVNSTNPMKVNSPQLQLSGALSALLGVISGGAVSGTNFSGASGAPAAATNGLQIGASSTSTALLFKYQYVQPANAAIVTLIKGTPATIVDPASMLSSLTIAFPTMDPVLDDGAVFYISFSQYVTTLAYSNATFGGGGTYTWPTTIPEVDLTTAGGYGQTGWAFGFIYLGGTIMKWFRI